MKKRFNIILFVSAILFFAGCGSQPERFFWSPYQDLNWLEIGHYDSEFHTHPGLGDEQYDPHQTVDRYYEEGYKILALAGHDYDIPDDYNKQHLSMDQPFRNIREESKPVIELISYILDAEEPDLVVFTGDVVTGKPVNAGWRSVLEPVVERSIPFAVLRCLWQGM